MYGWRAIPNTLTRKRGGAGFGLAGVPGAGGGTKPGVVGVSYSVIVRLATLFVIHVFGPNARYVGVVGGTAPAAGNPGSRCVSRLTAASAERSCIICCGFRRIDCVFAAALN